MAQLVERRGRNAKATGSNPVISTIQEQRCDTTVLNLFSLHKGFISLSVNEHQSLVRVFNCTFARLFFAYHHALACISSPQAYIINRRLYHFRNDDMQNFVLMIFNFCEIDDIQGYCLDFE